MKLCPACTHEYLKLKQVLSLAQAKKPPEPSGQFWAKFEGELAEKLAQEKVLPEKELLRPRPFLQLVPKPVFAAAAVVIVLLSLSLLLFGGLPTPERLNTMADQRLLKDIEVWEEVTGRYVFLEDEEILLREVALLDEIG